jgi:hypothetical protein
MLTAALCGPFVFVDEAAEDRTALDLVTGEVSDRAVGASAGRMSAALAGWVRSAASGLRRCGRAKTAPIAQTSATPEFPQRPHAFDLDKEE